MQEGRSTNVSARFLLLFFTVPLVSSIKSEVLNSTKCDPACRSCYGESAEQCLECNYYLYRDTCLNACPNNSFSVETGNVTANTPTSLVDYNDTNLKDVRSPFMCRECHPECFNGCTGPSERDCVGYCEHLRTANGTCVESCPVDTFQSEGKCLPCHEECDGCHGNTSTECVTCRNVMYNGQCFNSCPGNTTVSYDNLCERAPMEDGDNNSENTGNIHNITFIVIVVILLVVIVILLLLNSCVRRILHKKYLKVRSWFGNRRSMYAIENNATGFTNGSCTHRAVEEIVHGEFSMPMDSEIKKTGRVDRGQPARLGNDNELRGLGESLTSPLFAGNSNDVALRLDPSLDLNVNAVNLRVTSVSQYREARCASSMFGDSWQDDGYSDCFSNAGYGEEPSCSNITGIQSRQSGSELGESDAAMACSDTFGHEARYADSSAVSNLRNSSNSGQKMPRPISMNHMSLDSGFDSRPCSVTEIMGGGSRNRDKITGVVLDLNAPLEATNSELPQTTRTADSSIGQANAEKSIATCTTSAQADDEKMFEEITNTKDDTKTVQSVTPNNLNAAPSHNERSKDHLMAEFSKPECVTVNSDEEKAAYQQWKQFEKGMRQELGRGTVIGQCFQKDNFVIGVFNKRGGHLQHSKLKVNLFIPPNAIPDDERREIYMYITQEDNDDDGMALSPTVYCGPHPYRFNRHLLLTFPHYASRMEEWDVEMKIKPTNDPCNSDGPRHECWKPLHGDSESKTHVEGDRCYVYINHFTGFKLMGRPLSLTPMIEMLVLIFLQPVTSFSVKIRVYILHNHDSLKEQILNDEMRTWHGRPTQGPPQILHMLYASQPTMTIAAKVTSRGVCSVHPDKHECVAIATGVNRYVFRTFIMKPNPEENQTLDFDIELIWNGDNRLLIPISESIGAQEPQAAALDPVQITMKACREEFSRLPINRQVIPDHAFGDLCIYLDQTMDPSPSPDYRHLAERMGIPPNIIQWIALQKGGYTSKVLSWWEEKTKRENPRESRYDSLKKLEALLQDIGHNGAVQVIRKLTRDSGISVGARSLASSLGGSNASKSKLQPYGTELAV